MGQETKESTNQHDIAVVTPAQGDVVGAAPTTEIPCPTWRASLASRLRRNSLRQQDAPKPQDKPISRRSTTCSPNPRAGILPVRCAGC